MNKYINPHPFDPTLRYVVERDSDNDLKISDYIGEDYGVLTVKCARHINFSEHITPYGETPLPDKTVEGLRQNTPEFALRFLKMLGYEATVKAVLGESPSNWAIIIVYGDPVFTPLEFLEAAAEEIDLWFSGEVYSLTLEKRKVYTAEDGDTITKWEHQYSIGGYLTAEPDKLHLNGDI